MAAIARATGLLPAEKLMLSGDSVFPLREMLALQREKPEPLATIEPVNTILLAGSYFAATFVTATKGRIAGLTSIKTESAPLAVELVDMPMTVKLNVEG